MHTNTVYTRFVRKRIGTNVITANLDTIVTINYKQMCIRHVLVNV